MYVHTLYIHYNSLSLSLSIYIYIYMYNIYIYIYIDVMKSAPPQSRRWASARPGPGTPGPRSRRAGPAVSLGYVNIIDVISYVIRTIITILNISAV